MDCGGDDSAARHDDRREKRGQPGDEFVPSTPRSRTLSVAHAFSFRIGLLTTEGVSLPPNSLPLRRLAIVTNHGKHERLTLRSALDPISPIEPELLQPHARHVNEWDNRLPP